MTSIDGGSRQQNATRLRTFRRPGSFSFGDTFSGGERVEWFQFRTIGRVFNRASFTFAAAAARSRFEVFFRPASQSQGIGRRIGRLTPVDGVGDVFSAQSRSPGTYFIKATLRSSVSESYGVAFSFTDGFTRSGKQQANLAPAKDASGGGLFF